MSNIINFPKSRQTPTPKPPATSSTKEKPFIESVLHFTWIATVLVWPVLKWLVSIDVFFQFIRMIYHWSTPGVYVGWIFLLHFAALTALTCFVSIYKPRTLSIQK